MIRHAFDENILSFKQMDINNCVRDSKLLYDDGVGEWNQRYKTDLIRALDVLKSYVEVDSELLLKKVFEQEISVVMHGVFLFQMREYVAELT